MTIKNQKIILGSKSPRRQQLLSGLDLKFEVRVKETPEVAPDGLQDGQIADYIARQKADALFNELNENELLITADTIVCIDHEVLGKPANRQEAMDMLKKLSGQIHRVFTGVCLTTTRMQSCFISESIVLFKEIDDDKISDYVDHYNPFDKAGAYGAQECLPEGVNPCSAKEIQFLKSIGKPRLFEDSLAMDNQKHVPIIERIEGSYFNVMGLPVVELWERLETFRV